MSTLRYRYRIYPTVKQQSELARVFGCARLVWNIALSRASQKGGKYPGFPATSRALTKDKKTEELSFLSEVAAVPLQQSLKKLGVAYKRFFDGIKGKGPKTRYPRFKSKYSDQSAQYTTSGFKIQKNKLVLVKLGAVKVKWSRKLPSNPKTATVKLDKAGRYFVTFTVEKDDESMSGGAPVGIDLGIKTFAALSTGEDVLAPTAQYTKLDRKIRKAQRKLARKQKDSNRRAKAKRYLAKLWARVSDLRKDFLEQLSTRIVREHNIICIEDLNVSGMVKNHALARSISSQGWRMFRTMLESKCARYGRELVVLDRWKPTSQVCSSCGHVWGKLALSERRVRCESCGEEHDRDTNAARNIVAAGLAETENGRGGRVRRSDSSEEERSAR